MVMGFLNPMRHGHVFQSHRFFFDTRLFFSASPRWGWLKMILQTNRCACRWQGLRAYEMGRWGGGCCWHDCWWKWVLCLSHIDFDCQTSLYTTGSGWYVRRRTDYAGWCCHVMDELILPSQTRRLKLLIDYVFLLVKPKSILLHLVWETYSTF